MTGAPTMCHSQSHADLLHLCSFLMFNSKEVFVLKYRFTHSAVKVGPLVIFPRLIVSGGAVLSTEGPILLCALIGLPAAESLYPIGQTGTSLCFCFSHDHCLGFGN